MSRFIFIASVLLCLACSKDTVTVIVEEQPESSVPIITSGISAFCYSSLTGTNASVFVYDSPSATDQIAYNPSQSWIDNYFVPQIEHKLFHYSISFPDDLVSVRLFIPSEDSTRVRQAFISETEIVKTIGGGSYSSGYMFPPNQEMQFYWNFKDSQGAAVALGWYAFSTEFVDEDRSVIFWFKLVE